MYVIMNINSNEYLNSNIYPSPSPSRSNIYRITMAVKEVAILMEKHQGKHRDGSCVGRKGLAILKSKLETSPSSSPSSSSPKLKCPKVPKRLREMVKGAEDCYAPKLISLAPYYHGESRLAGGEELKLKLAKD